MGRPSRVSYYKAKRAYDKAHSAFLEHPKVARSYEKLNAATTDIDHQIAAKNERIEEIKAQIGQLNNDKFKLTTAHRKRVFEGFDFLDVRNEFKLYTFENKLAEQDRIMRDAGWHSWDLHGNTYDSWLDKAELSEEFGMPYHKIDWWDIEILTIQQIAVSAGGGEGNFWRNVTWSAAYYPGTDPKDAVLRCTGKYHNREGSPLFASAEEVSEEEANVPYESVRVTAFGRTIAPRPEDVTYFRVVKNESLNQ